MGVSGQASIAERERPVLIVATNHTWRKAGERAPQSALLSLMRSQEHTLRLSQE